ncbi:hypothetical protein B7P43_G03186, partial [Cryptotermes secundus]
SEYFMEPEGSFPCPQEPSGFPTNILYALLLLLFSGHWFFHHDNAPAHTALSVRQFLTKNGMTPVPHPPYSPDHAPCDFFFLFPRMKRDMKGKRFADVAEVKEKTTEALSSISKDEFRQCFEKWNKRLDKCISVSGEYFEGD